MHEVPYFCNKKKITSTADHEKTTQLWGSGKRMSMDTSIRM
jgi:hypothetical protein